ncbi:histidine ammonia-lyase [Halorussus gelatinilyticus]|uniref:Probable histidine ammonia-lyase n=1 Tax=Halorussus gelatinilyticus TaxID=2937524 RepID=A0A8U0IMV7_9EURY|nr:histidine ammonia-lyase [Halorussus gelatinilyticus]UPW01941.1 histidine ammonia-lyase [Halorussus gelatinilyticus]
MGDDGAGSDGDGGPESDSDAGPVLADGENLTPEDVARVAREDAPVVVTDETREKIRTARERVEEVVESGEVVYGLNTGFGELVDERIPREDIEQLQLNLVRSHAAGAGRELTTEEVRAMLLGRVNALAKGYSGVREVVVDHLVTMLDERVHPVVKSRGSLGASGDLAPLAHLALVLVGEGEAEVEIETDDGERRTERLPGDEALATAGLDPLTLRAKEGLALINGTQLSAGLAALAVVDAERAVRAGDVAGALTTEVTMGTTASADESIAAVRPHAGHAESARNVKRLTEDSEVVESHRNCDRVQDAYSIRCLPQVHGAVRDAIRHLREAVEVELNSATDNPLIFDAADADERASGTENAAVLSGGNFHGDPLALPLDYLTNAITELAAICERRVDRMLNPNVQEPHLPPFLTEGSGLRSGYMIAQYTAAALVNENRATGRPSMDNTPVSGNQEDHVSMSAQSAFDARAAVENALTVVGIELLCGAQAAEFLDDDLSHGVGTGAAYEAVRDVVPPLVEDRPLHEDVERADALVASGLLTERVEDALGESLE